MPGFDDASYNNEPPDKAEYGKWEAAQRAQARAANPLKLMISGAERHISEAIRVGAGAGTEYAIAAHRMLTQALTLMDLERK